MKRYFLTLGMIFCLIALAWGYYSYNKPSAEPTVTIFTDSTEIIFDVELALTDNQWQTGLMYRREMPQNRGMLFSFPMSTRFSMWMKNTYIPLDMIFMDQNGIIVDIAENARPHDLTHITPRVPAKHVLEINAGLCKKHAIKIGHRAKLVY